MRLLINSSLLIMLSLAFACNTDTESGEAGVKKVEGIQVADGVSNADIIRSPITADDSTRDTVNIADIDFEEMIYNYGVVDKGAVITRSFKFTNTGKIPLMIGDAKTTCGCTVPNWPEDPILPGEGGIIKVKFDTSNKKAGRHKPPITIIANTYPRETIIYLDGIVE